MDKQNTNVRTISTIEEYKKHTGKRFRMTKEQKARGIDRNTAFAEFLAGSSVKARNTTNP